MRRRTSATESRTGRFYGFASIGALTGIVVFLLVFPTVEREAYLNDLRSDDADAWSSAVLHLCWTRAGLAGIESVLDESDRDHRRDLLETIVDEGCLQELSAQHRAHHYFETGDIDSFIGHGDSHADIAVEALHDDDAARVSRADRALAALWPSLEESRRSTIREAVKKSTPEKLPRLYDVIEFETAEEREEEEADEELRLGTMVDAVIGAEHAVHQTQELAEALASLESLPEPDMNLKLTEPSLRAPSRAGPLFSKGERETPSEEDADDEPQP